MAVVRIDAHRRIYLPKEIDLDADRVVVLRQGAAILLIPVPEKPIDIDVKEDVKELKAKAERYARKDALQRYKRRADR